MCSPSMRLLLLWVYKWAICKCAKSWEWPSERLLPKFSKRFLDRSPFKLTLLNTVYNCALSCSKIFWLELMLGILKRIEGPVQNSCTCCRSSKVVNSVFSGPTQPAQTWLNQKSKDIKSITASWGLSWPCKLLAFLRLNRCALIIPAQAWKSQWFFCPCSFQFA